MWKKVYFAGKTSLALGGGWVIASFFTIKYNKTFALAWLANGLLFIAAGVFCLKLSKRHIGIFKSDAVSQKIPSWVGLPLSMTNVKDIQTLLVGFLGCMTGPFLGIPIILINTHKIKKGNTNFALKIAIILCVFGASVHLLVILFFVCYYNGFNVFS